MGPRAWPCSEQDPHLHPVHFCASEANYRSRLSFGSDCLEADWRFPWSFFGLGLPMTTLLEQLEESREAFYLPGHSITIRRSTSAINGRDAEDERWGKDMKSPCLLPKSPTH